MVQPDTVNKNVSECHSAVYILEVPPSKVLHYHPGFSRSKFCQTPAPLTSIDPFGPYANKTLISLFYYHIYNFNFIVYLSLFDLSL